MAKVLILEQSKSMRNILRERLEFEGFATAVAERDELSESMVARRGYDAILAGSETEQVSALGVPFIIVTPSGTIDGAVAAVKSGAEDYLTAPVDMNRLLGSLRRCFTLLVFTEHLLAGGVENLVGCIAVQIHGVIVFWNPPSIHHQFIHSLFLLLDYIYRFATFGRKPRAASSQNSDA